MQARKMKEPREILLYLDRYQETFAPTPTVSVGISENSPLDFLDKGLGSSEPLPGFLEGLRDVLGDFLPLCDDFLTSFFDFFFNTSN